MYSIKFSIKKKKRKNVALCAAAVLLSGFRSTNAILKLV